MAARDEPDLLVSLELGKVDPVYCLYGAERYLVDERVTAIRAAVLGAGAAAGGLNHDVFELKDSGLGPALTAAKTLPMFGRHRLVVGRGIDQLKSDDLEPLSAYVADPNPSTCLVLIGEKIDARLRAFQSLRKTGYLHDFPRLKDREVVTWISREATRRKIAIESDAVQALAEAAGSDLGRLAQALEQLSLYAGTQGARIRREHVEDLIADTRERSVFELTRAIGEGNAPWALKLVSNMLRNREPPLRIHYMLMRQLRQIWRAKELAETDASRQDLASAVGISPYFLDDVLVPARRMSSEALRRSFRTLYDADRSLKSSRLSPELQVTRLVQSLVSLPRTGAAGRTT